MDKWDAIVIGGGVSGLTAGALLANAGRRVLLLEKESKVGGRASASEYRGQIVDNGIHGLLSMGYMEEIYRRLGKPFPEYVVYDEGADVFSDGEWRSFGETFMTKDFRQILKSDILSQPYEALEKYQSMSVKDWLSERTDDKAIHEYFAFMAWAILGGHRYEDMAASRLLEILKEVREKRGHLAGLGAINFRGGLSTLTGPLAEAIKERGGQIRTDANVANVVVKEGVARGVEIESGNPLFVSQFHDSQFVEADMVVATVPIWSLFSVVPEGHFPRWYVDWIKGISPRKCLIMTLVCGMDELLWKEWKCIRFVSHLPRTGLGGLLMFAPTYAERVGEYQAWFWLQIHWDEVPPLFSQHRARRRLALRHTFDSFEADIQEVLPGFQQHCLWKIRHHDYFGLAEAPAVVGAFRPSIKPPGIENFYLVSDTLSSGRSTGMESCASLALQLVDEVLAST